MSRDGLCKNTITQFTNRKFDHLYFPMSIYLNSRLGLGTNVFDLDWDCLIVLDTCRPDGLNEVACDYDFIEHIGSYWSVGGDSWEWMANTFTTDYIEAIRETGLITSNAAAKSVIEFNLMKNREGENIHKRKLKRLRRYGRFNIVSADDFGYYQCLIDSYDNEFNYPSPRQVTDCAIKADRNMNLDKLILHYMPPHRPYIIDDPGDDFEGQNQKPTKFSDSKLSNTWQAYLNNLRWGLNEIELLLKNISRNKVIITADHGESFNSLSPNHYAGQLVPSVRKVPKVRANACDSGEYVPQFTPDVRNSGKIKDVLRALGYI